MPNGQILTTQIQIIFTVSPSRFLRDLSPRGVNGVVRVLRVKMCVVGGLGRFNRSCTAGFCDSKRLHSQLSPSYKKKPEKKISKLWLHHVFISPLKSNSNKCLHGSFKNEAQTLHRTGSYLPTRSSVYKFSDYVFFLNMTCSADKSRNNRVMALTRRRVSGCRVVSDFAEVIHLLSSRCRQLNRFWIHSL